MAEHPVVNPPHVVKRLVDRILGFLGAFCAYHLDGYVLVENSDVARGVAAYLRVPIEQVYGYVDLPSKILWITDITRGEL